MTPKPMVQPRCPAVRAARVTAIGRRGHQDQHAGGVGAALGVDVGVEDPGDEEARSAVKTSTSGRTARAQSGAMP